VTAHRVGEHRVAEHGAAAAHKNVVDAVGQGRIELEALEGANGAVGGLLSELVSIAELCLQNFDLLSIGRRVKVAYADHRRIFGNFSDFLHHQVARLAARFHALMVEVHAEKVEHLSGLEVLELCPGADAVASGGVPALAGAVGRLAQPEVAGLEQLQAGFFVEDG